MRRVNKRTLAGSAWYAGERVGEEAQRAWMRRRAHEKVQGANPHRLTLWQHVFPAASIARFAGPDDRVAVIDLVRRTARRARARPARQR